MSPRFFLALLGCTASLQAQSIHEPQPDGRRLQLGTDSLEVFVVRQGQQQRTGTILDRLDTVRVNGELRFHRVYRRVDLVLGTGVDTLVDRYPDLAPRTVRSWSDDGGTETTVWRAGRVTGVLEQPNKPQRSIDTTVAASVYSSASFDLILRASPLAEGYEVAVPAYSGRQGAKNLTAKVVATEMIAGFGDTWRVDANFGGLSVTYWIAKTSRRVVRRIVRVTPETELLFTAKRGSTT
jgi:hypothetical protein